MAVRSGFWNSVGTDVRTYYNHDFSHLISLMIKDGIHQNYGECLTVVQGTGMQAIVRTGEAWFNETWVRCDSDLQISVDEAPIVAGFSRIDAIAIKIDATQSVRNGTIEYIVGTATAETPSAPELVDTDEIHWHLLATILVRTGDEEVLGSRITNYVGTDTTPFISGILDTISAEVLLSQWQSEWSEWSDEKKREFTLWFNNLHYILDGDVAGHLQNEIEDLYRSIGFTGTMAEVEAAIQAGTITVGMIVNITDDNDAEDFTALQVSYDGTESGSEATSVQGAIDEDKEAIKRINTDLSDIGNSVVYLGAISTAGNTITVTGGISQYRNLIVEIEDTETPARRTQANYPVSTLDENVYYVDGSTWPSNGGSSISASTYITIQWSISSDVITLRELKKSVWNLREVRFYGIK